MDREFLKELLGAVSVSGCEEPAQEAALAFGRSFAHRQITDAAGNAISIVNPDAPCRALLCGHIGGARKPCDAFFDYCCMGEFLAWRVREIDSYFEIFTPEMMQRLFVPRSVDMLTGVSGQFRRWRECWAPDLYVKYNPREPKLDRAIRHFLAYARMHDLITENLFDPQCALLEKTIAELGADRTFEAYYTDGEKSVALSAPGPRQLWGRLDGAGKTLLILLNDTDSPVEQTVTAKGLSRKGRDIFSSKTYDFSSGSCKLSLPPRESAFIMF